MDQFYKDARTPLRMREGLLGAHVDEFARQLTEEGYARASARYALQLVAALGRWMGRRRIVAQQLSRFDPTRSDGLRPPPRAGQPQRRPALRCDDH